MIGNATVAHCRRHRTSVALALAMGLAACAGAPPLAEVDGGTPEVALLGELILPAEPGDTVTISHTSPRSEGDGEEAPVTHAFVGGTGDGLPPIFVESGGGLAPNPGVWGACRGGDAAAAAQGCPIPPVEGPRAWNGRDYWSIGAMVPGESREVAIADDIAAGDHPLVCALHPALRVVVRVGHGAPEPPARDVEAAVADALAAAAAPDPHQGPWEVLAGVGTGDAYVARFVPETVTVPVGATVTWEAGARTPVDVVFGIDSHDLSLVHTEPADANPSGDTDAWDGKGVVRSGFLSSDVSAGARARTWSVTFTEPGTYTYASRFAPTLTGTVVVADV